MASRTYFPIEGNFHRPIVFGCGWTPNNTAAPSGLQGSRVSVARTGVGVYVLTFVDKYPALISGFASVGSDVPVVNTSKSVDANLSSYNQAARTITVTLMDNTGTPVDVPSTNNAYVSVTLLFKNSGAKN